MVKKKTKKVASLKIGKIFGKYAKLWKVFKTGGCTYFTQLVDRFISYTNKIGSSVMVRWNTWSAEF